jgi:hypothetical protein
MKKYFILIFNLLTFFISYSQNDLCSNAISLTPTLSCTNPTIGTFSGSTISSTAPSCAPNSLQDVWYSFVATDPTMRVLLSATNGVNHSFEILDGTCSGTSLVCVNNNGVSSSESYLNNNYVVGQTYYIRVLNVAASLSTANFGICVQNYPTPSNDLCQNAISLTPSTTCNYSTATFSGSSISNPTPSCALNSSQDIWYSFVATDPTMSIRLQAASGLNHAFEIFESSCTGTSTVCTNESSVSFGSYSQLVGLGIVVLLPNNSWANWLFGNFSLLKQPNS